MQFSIENKLIRKVGMADIFRNQNQHCFGILYVKNHQIIFTVAS